MAVAIAIGAFGSVCAGAAAERVFDGSAVETPDWLTTPSADEQMQTYPAEAFNSGVEGETDLRCKVKADGGLAGAIRDLAAGLRAAPETWDAIATRGQIVGVGFDWVLLRSATNPARTAAR